jgi:hypothetical protein
VQGSCRGRGGGFAWPHAHFWVLLEENRRSAKFLQSSGGASYTGMLRFVPESIDCAYFIHIGDLISASHFVGHGLSREAHRFT